MRAFVQRLIQLVLVLLLVTLFTSFLIDAVPGDVTYTLAPVATPQQRDALRHELHLDRSPLERYREWVTGLVHGDLGCYYGTSGYSTASSCPDKVADRVKDALPISLLLMFYAQLLALVIAIPMGVLTAYRAGSVFDKTVNTTAFALLAIPNFVLALVLAYYVGTKLGWVDPTGYIDFGQDPVGHFQQLALPVISLAVGQIAVYMRLLRSDMIATLQEDFVTMARAKGLSPARILWRHALAAVEPDLADRGGPQCRRAHRRRGGDREHLRDPRHGLPDRRCHRPPPVRGAAELCRHPRAGLRAGELLRRHPLRHPRPTDTPCQSNRLVPRPPSTTVPRPSKRLPYPRVRRPSSSTFRRWKASPSSRKPRRSDSASWVGWRWRGWSTSLIWAIFAPVLPIPSPSKHFLLDTNQGPSLSHPMGTDGTGQDMLSRVIWGARASLVVAVAAVLFGLIFGGFFGLIAGYYRGKLDTVLVNIFNVFLAIPQLVLALALVAVFASDPAVSVGKREFWLIISIGLVSIPIIGRITRAATLTWAQREFVLASRQHGREERSDHAP